MAIDAPADSEELDAVDRIMEQWETERPDVDVSPMGVVGRLHRVGGILEEGLSRVFRSAGLGNGDFDVLATLRRSGAPYAMTPSELSAHTMVTSGAVTKRVDRLEQAGLVRRTVRSDDARGRTIALTEEGRELVDRLLVDHMANEDALLAPLDGEQRAVLAGLLRTLLNGLE
jgi:DNA-binding MarR family transcriptional regulator